MKILNKCVLIRSLAAAVFLTSSCLIFPQPVIKTIKHSVSGDNTSGAFSVVSTDQQNLKNVEVQEISISVMNNTGKSIVISADLIELVDPKTSSGNVTATVKSFSDPGYVRKEKTMKEEEPDASEESGEFEEMGDEENGSVPAKSAQAEEKDPYENITEDNVPAKMYLEVNSDGSESTYSFYDRNDLESIISGLNNQYGTNFEVAGSGRNVYVTKSAAKKSELKKSASARVSLQKSELESGSYTEVLKFDIIKLESELLKDKILDKNKIKSYTFMIDEDDLYVNGNKIPDKITAKYRKIFAKFSFNYTDD